MTPLNFKVAAAFGWGGKAFTDQIGSIQVLCELPDHVRGFDYQWCSFKEAAIFDKDRKQFFPVHVDSVKGWFKFFKFTFNQKLISPKFQETSRHAC